MTNETWRDPVVNAVRKIYNWDDTTHGLVHAMEVEQKVVQIAGEFRDSRKINLIALRAGALLHDTGYTKDDGKWSVGKVEHIRESVSIAISVLSEISPFKEDSQLMQLTCYIILHHDDTNYSFPIQKHGYGEVYEPNNYKDLFDWSAISSIENADLELMVNIMQEADSLMGIGEKGADRTWQYSLNRSVPPFSNGNPLDAVMWEESAGSNVILGAKRALLDAISTDGRQEAKDGFRITKNYLKKICDRNGILYEPDPRLEISDLEYGKLQKSNNCKVVGYQNWDLLVSLLRRVPLRGDPTLFPYSGATIKSVILPITKLNPTSYYVLDSQIELHKKISQNLVQNYALDIFNLSGIIEFYLNGEHYKLAPLIVELYKETSGEIKGEVYALVDGLHRCYTAKQLGLTHIRAVLISDIAPQFPLVPLPLKWTDVKKTTEVPNPSNKRKYRFNEIQKFHALIEKFPLVYPQSSILDNPSEVKYYTYRDLSEIGSDGIRMAKDKKK